MGGGEEGGILPQDPGHSLQHHMVDGSHIYLSQSCHYLIFPEQAKYANGTMGYFKALQD